MEARFCSLNFTLFQIANHALMANFLSGKDLSLCRVLAVFKDFSWAESAFLMALVFLGRRSRGLYFLPRRRIGLVMSASSIRTIALVPVTEIILTLVELPQVLLLLLVHHDVDPGDGLADHADLGELRGGAAGHLQTTVRTALTTYL